MKKLQNNFTTPEQSKRLLELGVPADSADMLWDGYIDSANRWVIDSYPRYLEHLYSAEIECDSELYMLNVLPCWSVGRLMEIYEICTGETFERNDIYNISSDIFTTIESALLNHKLNFSKLEE